MSSNFKNVALAAILSLFLWSCSGNRFEVDVDSVVLEDRSLKQLHNDMFGFNEQNIAKHTQQLQHEYGNFYERYIVSFISAKGISDSLYAFNVLKFTTDKDILTCRKDIQKLYSAEELTALQKNTNNCIKRFHTFFPKKTLPKQIVSCQSGWNYSTACIDSTLVVGLDMYLGSNSVFYQMLNFQYYRTRCMTKDYIIPDLMQGWMLTEFDNDVATNTLLNHTIFYGKVFFAVKALAPEVEDSVILHYTTKQMEYCKSFEKNLWGYMAEKNRLYENNMRTVQELTGEGPFTAAISKDCPPGIAKWIGWQIVKSYMKNNESVSLEQLMNERDAQKILNKSKYRP